MSHSLSACIAPNKGPRSFLLYAVCVLNFKLRSLILLPILLAVTLQLTRHVKAGEHDIVAPEAKATVLNVESPSPCTELDITNVGAVCQSRFGPVARLDFPHVDLKGALAGRNFLPQAREAFTVDKKTIGDKTYRNIDFLLRWEPATPEFLQIYLNEYVPYWGNRVPYRFLWSASYEECLIDHCSRWQTVSEKGEILPADVKDLPSDLAADVNFNGVPAAFWNTHVIP